MVKDEHHRTREIVDEEGVAGIARNQSVFQFVYRLQRRFTDSPLPECQDEAKNACQVIADSSRWHRPGKARPYLLTLAR